MGVNDNKSEKHGRILLTVACVMGVIFLVVCGVIFALLKKREAEHKAQLQQLQEQARISTNLPQIEYDEEKPMEYNPINFQELYNTNPDIVAWLEVPGTAVDYPVLRSNENQEEDYYLSHNVDGSGGYPGSIYMQKCSAADLSSYVTVIYGHNMKDGSMFAGLHQFEDLEFFNANREFTIYTPNDVKHYEIVAATYYDDRLIPSYYHSFLSREDTGNFLNSLLQEDDDERNHFLSYDALDSSVDYVVLSTCTKNSKTRYLVVGKLRN